MSPAPAVTPTTTSMWGRFPEKDRLVDELHDWTLLRFLSLLGDQVDVANVLVDRFQVDTVDDTSHLTDPAKADAAWLPWLAQFVGLRAADFETLGALRVAIETLLLDAGSYDSVVRVLEAYLAPPKRYLIVKHYLGDPWTVAIFVHPDDTGLPTWNAIEANFGTWAAIEAAGSWAGLGDTGDFLFGHLESVRPAGVFFDLQFDSDLEAP